MTEFEFEKFYEGRKSMYDEIIERFQNINHKGKEHGFTFISVDEILKVIESIDISKGYKVEE